MRIVLELVFPKGHHLPVQYNYHVQSALYHTMDPHLATLIHDHGMVGGGRTFRLFTFSQLRGPFQFSPERRFLTFNQGCSLTISSPATSLLESLVHQFVSRPELIIGPNRAEIRRISTERINLAVPSSIFVHTLSPVVAYSTMVKMNGKKYTVYRDPSESDFRNLVESNLRKKLMALRHWTMDAPRAEFASMNGVIPFSVLPVGKPPHAHVMRYLGTVIKAYSGQFTLQGPPALLLMALEAGLGSKNAQGFGCLELLGSERFKSRKGNPR